VTGGRVVLPKEGRRPRFVFELDTRRAMRTRHGTSACEARRCRAEKNVRLSNSARTHRLFQIPDGACGVRNLDRCSNSKTKRGCRHIGRHPPARRDDCFSGEGEGW
jgi:hypothetical protein